MEAVLGQVAVALVTAVIGPIVVARMTREKPVMAAAAFTPAPGMAAAGGVAAPPSYVPASSGAPVERASNSVSVTALVLSLVGLVAWIIPIFGLPISMLGVIFGVAGRDSSKRTMATVALIIAEICLVATAANSAIGAYMGATGKLFE